MGDVYWFGFFVLFRFFGFGFDVSLIFVFFIVVVVSLIEFIGVYYVLSEIIGRKLERKDFWKGYIVEGLVIILGLIFNVFFYIVYF